MTAAELNKLDVLCYTCGGNIVFEQFPDSIRSHCIKCENKVDKLQSDVDYYVELEAGADY